jgi:membrane-bound acyltransferase YfiQ involved in biofilm formation
MCFREAWGKCLYFSLATVVNNMKCYYYYFGTNEPIHCEEEERMVYYFVKTHNIWISLYVYFTLGLIFSLNNI